MKGGIIEIPKKIGKDITIYVGFDFSMFLGVTIMLPTNPFPLILNPTPINKHLR